MREAMLYRRQDDGAVRCSLCAHGCLIQPQESGACGVRRNVNGTLYTLNYGLVSALNLDPIEKKPLYHFLPGSFSLSLGSLGCNFDCPFCQNWELSQPGNGNWSCRQQADGWELHSTAGQQLAPGDVVHQAIRSGAASISFTYNEPTASLEYVLETAALAKQHGIRAVFVSNGYLSLTALRMLRGVIDAMNIDLKFFKEELYVEYCHASLKPVLSVIDTALGLGIWVEITTLVIPGVSESPTQLSGIAGFIAGLSSDIPWHITAFHPAYRMQHHPATPPEALRAAYDTGKRAGLNHVYLGNLPDRERSTTFCPSCHAVLVERDRFALSNYRIIEDVCPRCRTRIAGVWS